MSTIRAACVQFSARARQVRERRADGAARGRGRRSAAPTSCSSPRSGTRGWTARACARWPSGSTPARPSTRWPAGRASTASTSSAARSRSPADDETGRSNVSIAFDRRGNQVAAYTKIHLFDVDVGGFSYRESDGTAPGSELVTAELDGITVGLTVCYDLRFPELYRALALDRGARILTIPSNFTLHTGMAHWEVLLRARAIENQAFVLATGQHGTPGGLDKPSYGHSMIIDPWGTVLAQAPDGDGVIVADLDLAAQAAIRERLPALLHIRPDLYQTTHPAHT